MRDVGGGGGTDVDIEEERRSPLGDRKNKFKGGVIDVYSQVEPS